MAALKLRGLGGFLILMIFVIAFLAWSAFVFTLLWNFVAVAVFGAPALSYLQGAALLGLLIFFKGFFFGVPQWPSTSRAQNESKST